MPRLRIPSPLPSQSRGVSVPRENPPSCYGHTSTIIGGEAHHAHERGNEGKKTQHTGTRCRFLVSSLFATKYVYQYAKRSRSWTIVTARRERPGGGGGGGGQKPEPLDGPKLGFGSTRKRPQILQPKRQSQNSCYIAVERSNAPRVCFERQKKITRNTQRITRSEATVETEHFSRSETTHRNNKPPVRQKKKEKMTNRQVSSNSIATTLKSGTKTGRKPFSVTQRTNKSTPALYIDG